MLYRKNASEDWQQIDFDKVGPYNIGNIYIHDLQMGEYALAVKEAEVGTSGHLLPKKNTLEIFPNPSTDGYRIKINSNYHGELRIFNDSGQLVKSFATSPSQEQITWIPEGLAAGTYLVAFYQDSQAEPEVKRAVYLK